MKVEIKDGQIVGYSRIGKWANKNNISYKFHIRFYRGWSITENLVTTITLS